MAVSSVQQSLVFSRAALELFSLLYRLEHLTNLYIETGVGDKGSGRKREAEAKVTVHGSGKGQQLQCPAALRELRKWW